MKSPSLMTLLWSGLRCFEPVWEFGFVEVVVEGDSEGGGGRLEKFGSTYVTGWGPESVALLPLLFFWLLTRDLYVVHISSSISASKGVGSETSMANDEAATVDAEARFAMDPGQELVQDT